MLTTKANMKERIVLKCVKYARVYRYCNALYYKSLLVTKSERYDVDYI